MAFSLAFFALPRRTGPQWRSRKNTVLGRGGFALQAIRGRRHRSEPELGLARTHSWPPQAAAQHLLPLTAPPFLNPAGQLSAIHTRSLQWHCLVGKRSVPR